MGRDEPWYVSVERDAAEKVAAILALPISTDGMGSVGEIFDPWDLFPCLYGSYSGEFDQCAIDVLTEVLEGEKRRDDLGAEMFREMLCRANLCDYGSSPRVCFPTTKFKEILPELIAKWREYSAVRWSN